MSKQVNVSLCKKDKKQNRTFSALLLHLIQMKADVRSNGWYKNMEQA